MFERVLTWTSYFLFFLVVNWSGKIHVDETNHRKMLKSNFLIDSRENLLVI